MSDEYTPPVSVYRVEKDTFAREEAWKITRVRSHMGWHIATYDSRQVAEDVAAFLTVHRYREVS